ncbi:MAG: 2-oxo-4-hydroxy-4-carboxy-5-ureidoimidazoline decarboxylase [Terracidiphilus sp.]
MNTTLQSWNAADTSDAIESMIACCGSRRWVEAMVALRPIASVLKLSESADHVWGTMNEADWMEAFATHPRIGERKAAHATAKSAAWSSQEQSSAVSAEASVLEELAQGNALYEQRFGFTYIVCATGKTADEMLTILNRRLTSDRATELREAAEQQRQIMQIRLGKWLVE